MLIWQPTPQFGRLLWALAFAVLAAVGVEVLRRQAAREFPGAVGVDWVGVTRERYDDWRAGRQAGRHAIPPGGVAGGLERLAALCATGALTDDEFSAAKAALIMPPPQG